jgi:hypothetical protein
MKTINSCMSRRSRATLLLCISLLGAGCAYGQFDTLNFPPPSVPVSAYAVEIKEAIRVDGKLSEISW